MDALDARLVQVKPSLRQLRLQEMEFYAFVHFTVNTFTDREWGDGTEDPAIFDPTALDARQWVRAVCAAGMKGLILTCKHHDGFCLWPSRYTAHSVASSPWKNGGGDVVAEVSAACREAGIAFGVYLSPWDRNCPLYGSGKPYDDYFVAQLTELLTGYGAISSVWFDGACGEGPCGKKQVYDWERYYAVIRALQPDACIHVCGPDIRWCGNEAGETRESEWSVVSRRTADTEKIASASQQTDGESFRQRPIRATDADLGSRALLAQEPELIWYPAEVDTSIRPGWFWHAAEDDSVRPLQTLIDIYEKAVGGNAMLLLNIPPTREGLFHANDVARLQQLGDYLRASYSENLLDTAAAQADPAAEGCGVENLRTRDESYYMPAAADGTAQLVFRWPTPQSLRRLVLQEQLRCSQRVERFAVDILADGEWRQAAAGTVIGHKRIVPLDGVRTEALRIRITDSRTAPTLRFAGVYA
ncbi:MAG: alpha-L-fucosidase [Oscillospiraceae bacterium]|nr:alpha-L-fucosidase [Oscillospiraceae bacterium]